MFLTQSLNSSSKNQQGFTLIELIVGIVVLTLSLSIVTTLIAPAEEQSADNILQIKASELAQSLMNDIMSRAFDDNSDMSGSRIRCGEPLDGEDNLCTTTIGVESDEDINDRNTFDDVDDFDGFEERVNSTDDLLDGGYSQFAILVSVSYAGTELGLADNALAKRITVEVTTPLGTAIRFTSHKANF
jgi:MSHA pilin protein MshD